MVAYSEANVNTLRLYSEAKNLSLLHYRKAQQLLVATGKTIFTRISQAKQARTPRKYSASSYKNNSKSSQPRWLARHSPGLLPVQRLKARLNALASEKPRRWAMSTKVSSVLATAVHAACLRTASTTSE